MIWFMFKYLALTVLPVLFMIGFLPSPESQILALLTYAGSSGIAAVSYLEYGDWLNVKFWRNKL